MIWESVLDCAFRLKDGKNEHRQNETSKISLHPDCRPRISLLSPISTAGCGRGAMGPDPIAPLKRGVSCQTGHDYKCNFLFLALPLLK